MSRYGVDKLLRAAVLDPDVRRRFSDEFEALATHFELTASEYQAFRDRDHVGLYGAGAHPQLLRRFYLAVWRGAEADTESYSASVGPHGRPSFAT